jgi:putative flippase GtrA
VNNRITSTIKKAWESQKIRYLLVGGYNTAFGYGVFAILWWFFNNQLHYIVLLTISHILSVINAYIGYRLVVFRAKGAWLYEFFKFNLVYLGSFAFNLAALPVFIEEFKIHPLIAQAIIIVFTVIFSYTLHSRVTFKKRKESAPLAKTSPPTKKRKRRKRRKHKR